MIKFNIDKFISFFKELFKQLLNGYTYILKKLNYFVENIYIYILERSWILSYLPFFENKEGKTDYYYVHIRIGWMEWEVYKYQYDIILDKYIFAYVVFLFIQFIFIMPFFYVFAIKFKYYIPEDMDRIKFFWKFNDLIDILIFLNFIIIISFYWNWPMSALSHSLFFKVLTKDLFGWGLFYLFFIFELALFLYGLIALRYSWRQAIVILVQFSIINLIVYGLWLGYHEYYSIKLLVFLMAQCFHSYCVGGWGYWYNEIDFEEIWRLGPQYEGWVYIHEWEEARKLRREKFQKILEYERSEYLKRKKERLEKKEKKNKEKQKLKEEGKLPWYVLFFDKIVEILYNIYWYFTYYDIELKKKKEQEKKDNFFNFIRDKEYQEKFINFYIENLPSYYTNRWTDHNIAREKLLNELNKTVNDDILLGKLYDLVIKPLKDKYEEMPFQNILEPLFKKRIRQSYAMHLDVYVIDRNPMTFKEFILSFEDGYNLVKWRKKLVDKYENLNEIMVEEDQKTYEQLLYADPEENLTFLRYNARNITVIKKFNESYKRDIKLWNEIYAKMYEDSMDVMIEYHKSIGDFIKMNQLIKQKEDMLNSLRNQTSVDNEDITEEEWEYINKTELKEYTPLTDTEVYELGMTSLRTDIYHIPFSWHYDNNLDQITFERKYKEYFDDYKTPEEKQAEQEFAESLWTETFKKWKELEEEEDYFKFSNTKQVIWYYDLEITLIATYIFYWCLSFDPIWFYFPIYGHTIITG
jgi:hypothetical protein